MKLDGKNIVVTGGAQGLGRACAERFLADGANVLISDINAAKLQETAAEIGADHVVADISRRAEVQTIIETCVASFGSIDVMLNNAGSCEKRRFSGYHG